MKTPKRYMVVSKDMLWVVGRADAIACAQTDSIEEARRIRDSATEVEPSPLKDSATEMEPSPLIDGLQDDRPEDLYIYDTATEEYVD